VGAEQGYGDNAGGGGTVVPGVARAVLDDAVSGLQVNLGAGIEFQKNLTGNNHIEIHSVRSVHAGIHGFENFGEAGKFGLEFREGCREIGELREVLRIGRHDEEAEAKASSGREVTSGDGTGGCRDLRSGIGASEAMEFEAGKKPERDGFDRGVFGEDGFSRRVMAGDDTADVHGNSRIRNCGITVHDFPRRERCVL